MGAPIRDELLIPNAHERRMIPGGATDEIDQKYAFRGGYAYFPAPGCWELVAKLGETSARFVVQLKEEREIR